MRAGNVLPLRKIAVAAVLCWTVIAIAVYVWEVADNNSFITANARAIAHASFEKDIAFRRWASRHGGVYVPATAGTPPNPYLNVPEREITTPSGRVLTLMNPAYMTRQIYEDIRSEPGALQGHITSLNPIRPENAPDAWERKVLNIFSNGTVEFGEYQDIAGIRHYRFMHVLKAEKACLKCHAGQGYREGDVRGGISVSVPVAELERIMRGSNGTHLVIIMLVWSIGMVGIWLSIRTTARGALALQESEERYRQQFEQSRAVMLIIDPDSGACVDANPAACSFYGYTREMLLALKISDIDITPPAGPASCGAGVPGGGNGQFIARHRQSDGTVVDVEVFSNPLVFQGTTRLHSIVSDITGRLVAERELRDKMDFAENLIMNSATPTFVVNFDHQVLIWNRAMEELSGIGAEEIVGTTEQWRPFYPQPRPCLADMVLEGQLGEAAELYANLSRSRLIPDCFSGEGVYTLAGRQCRLVFSAAPIRDRDGRIIAAIETLEDVTERISLETQLFHAQKMESVGVLAGGIAHDFNNVLTVINGYADLLKLTLQDEESLHIAGEITASVQRAADMTRRLLAFSGKHELLMQYEDLNMIISSIRKSLIRLIREDITLKIQPGIEPLPVYADRVQIEQILINLVINARDAMEAIGVITVATAAVHHREACFVGNSVIPPGRYACLSVVDSGIGMNAETLARIFEPFFTTKEKGKGTGLGLAIAHSITTKHNGCIAVVSTPGVGTEFRIYLPLYSGDLPEESGAEAQKMDHWGNETILMVDDDADIMKLHKDVFGRYGYSLLTACDGIEAIEVFDTHMDLIRVAVVDVIMPRMNGREVVERIRLLRPELPIIMTSGYTDEIIDRAALDELNVVFLQKPFKSLDLLATIRSCLQEHKYDNREGLCHASF